VASEDVLFWGGGQYGDDILVSNENLPPVYDIRQRDRRVVLPFLQRGGILNEDDEVVGAALVEDFVGGVVGAHCSCV
jgi:hypothetical protein